MAEEPAPAVRKRARLEKKKRDSKELKEHDVFVHKCSFVETAVHGVTALAVAPSGRAFAVARSGGRIELHVDSLGWDCADQVGDGSDEDVLALAFCADLFLWVGRMSGGLELYEVKQCGLRKVCTLHLGGGAVWGLCVSPEDYGVVAAACDDGCVKIIEVDGERYNHDDGMPRDELAYVIRSCGKTAKRILCLDWCGDVIVCGDAGGGLRWLNAVTGRVMGRGVLRGAKIWCVCFAKNGREAICGDSLGRVSVWDCATHTVCEEMHIEGMNGDVLSVAGEKNADSGSGETVLLGSASGAIGGLMAAPGAGAGDPWAPLRARKVHSHDVRSLVRLEYFEAVSGPGSARCRRFLAGSMDATVSEFGLGALLKDSRVKRLRPFCGLGTQPPVQFIGRTGGILTRYHDRVDLWSLSSDNPPVLTVRLALQSLGGGIRSCAASSNQRIIAVASSSMARIFVMDPVRTDVNAELADRSGTSSARESAMYERGATVVRPLGAVYSSLLTGLAGSRDMTIFGRRRTLCLLAITACGRSLFVGDGIPFSDDSQEEKTTNLRTGRWGMKNHLGCDVDTDRLLRIAISSSRRRLFAVSDSSGHVAVFDMDANGGSSDILSPPHNVRRFNADGLTTAMAFADNNSVLAVALSAGEVALLDLLTGSTTKIHVPDWVKQPTTCISLSPDLNSIVMSGGHHCIIASTGKHQPKKPIGQSDQSCDMCHDLGWYDNLQGTFIFGSQRMALVHRPWNLVTSTLPDVIPRKVYGT
jgi:WD40 repeat protein